LKPSFHFCEKGNEPELNNEAGDDRGEMKLSAAKRSVAE